MKKIAKDMMLALLLFITAGTATMGIIHYQENRDGGLVLSVVSLLLFFLLLFGKNED